MRSSLARLCGWLLAIGYWLLARVFNQLKKPLHFYDNLFQLDKFI